MIDSWAWIEYFKGTKFGDRAKEFIEGNEEVIASAMNVAEVYHFLLKNKPAEADSLMAFMLKTSFVITIGDKIALQGARNKYEKRLGMADAIILATSKMHGAKLVTGDDDLKNEKEVVFIG
ncbi:type II toxin-antitoxin system VapC family toxin [Candidatus Woesearchaeota archaeon]|nr:type II toxin-antitoxin system VapC family toxin [Candidatus Woesearchaeota archaeon]